MDRVEKAYKAFKIACEKSEYSTYDSQCKCETCKKIFQALYYKQCDAELRAVQHIGQAVNNCSSFTLKKLIKKYRFDPSMPFAYFSFEKGHLLQYKNLQERIQACLERNPKLENFQEVLQSEKG